MGKNPTAKIKTNVTQTPCPECPDGVLVDSCLHPHHGNVLTVQLCWSCGGVFPKKGEK